MQDCRGKSPRDGEMEMTTEAPGGDKKPEYFSKVLKEKPTDGIYEHEHITRKIAVLWTDPPPGRPLSLLGMIQIDFRRPNLFFASCEWRNSQ